MEINPQSGEAIFKVYGISKSVSFIFFQAQANQTLPPAVNYSCGVIADGRANHPVWQGKFKPDLGPLRQQIKVGNPVLDNYENGVSFQAFYSANDDQLKAILNIDGIKTSFSGENIVRNSLDKNLGWPTKYVQMKTALTPITGKTKTVCSVLHFANIGSLVQDGIKYELYCSVNTYEPVQSCRPTID